MSRFYSISFGGTLTVFENKDDAIEAAEDLCRKTKQSVSVLEHFEIKRVTFKGCNPLKWVTKQTTSKRR